ncbi:MAG: LCP family protein [Oscillospiraceae bacterium]|nr:LCP family protein [Oscillospiraceae bacterium]
MKLFGNKRDAAHYGEKRGRGREREDARREYKRYEEHEAYDDFEEYEAAVANYEERHGRDWQAEEADRDYWDDERYDDYDDYKAPAAPVRRRRGGRGRRVLAIFLILVLVSVGGVYALWNFLPEEPVVNGPGSSGPYVTPSNPAVPPGETRRPITILIAGQNNVGSLGLSNTLMLATVDVDNGRIDVASIARDTLVDLPGWNVPKINGVFSGTGGSMERLLDEVERLVGFRPDFYMRVNLPGFIEVVDALGGVTFDVPERMIYDDPFDSPPLHIDLWPGVQTLDGVQAMGLVRFRQNNDGSGPTDIGRMANQQAFLGAVADEVLRVRNIARIPEFVRIFSEHVHTDLTFGNLVWFGQQLMGMDRENINFHTMPVEVDVWMFGGNYVILELEPWLVMVNRYLNPFQVPVTEENVRVYTRVWDGTIQLVGGDRSLTAG